MAAHSARRTRLRNSNIEMLRIVAMLLIVFNHFPWNVDSIISGTSGVIRYILLDINALLINFGGVGDDLFFMISAWFLCMENPTIKRNLRRSWLLEKQLLFYAMLLFGIEIAMWRYASIGTMSKSELAIGAVNAFFPLVTSRWWYPTSYVLFLIIHPWVNQGLRSIGQMAHRNLAIISVLVWGIIPYFDLNMGYSVFLFMYLYTLVAYARWYIREGAISSSHMVWMILIGFVSGFLVNCAVQLVSPNSPVGAFWMNKPRCLPSLLMAFGLILRVARMPERKSMFVNKTASATLAVYLLLISPLSEYVSLWCNQYLATGWLRFGEECAVAIVFFCAAILTDFIRQGIFVVTVDRRKGRWFERAWLRLKKILPRCIAIDNDVLSLRSVNEKGNGRL
ncbi:acyltransferase family protein [Bifidobacterium leontopitheci]|uniref:Symporter n=1 Tax=Bifidobacterium leontopitheci TaxID=2650774 RepID=A0A6I1GIZ9_9BIFI|nr:acyltransferase family protein [Bifidobacterium leontopitheci]KAB7789606.1 symporter [Bifidobacterium leontopitheci]